MEKMFKIVKKSNNFIWIEVSKDMINIVSKKLLIVASYLNDITTTYYNQDIFD